MEVACGVAVAQEVRAVVCQTGRLLVRSPGSGDRTSLGVPEQDT